MRKILLFFSIIIILFFLLEKKFAIFRNFSEESQVSEQLKNRPQTQIQSQTQYKISSLPMVKRSEEKNKSVSADDEKGLFQKRIYGDRNHALFFQIKNKMVTSFGDIILGHLEEDSDVKQGFTEPPHISLWDNSTISYLIDKDVSQGDLIKESLSYLERNSHLKFIELTAEDKDGIIFMKGEEHCYSYLGKVGGIQPIFLSPECGVQEILHEMMHALGFFHEQSRIDRDDFITIFWDKIKEESLFNFSYIPDSYMSMIGNTSFDYNSIMLYPENAFIKEKGMNSMTSKTKEKIAPVAKGLSPVDLERLNSIY